MRARWLFYILLTLFSGTLVAGAFLVVWADHRASLANIEAQAQEAARAYAVHAWRNIHELNLGIEWLARSVDPQAPDYGLTPENTAMARLLAANLPGLSALVLVDADGKVRFSTATERAYGVDVADRDYFIAARDRKLPFFIGPMVRARGTQRLVYTVSMRVEVGGRFAGVALASTLPERWDGLIAPLVPVAGTRVRLLRPDGAVLVDQTRRSGAEGLVATTSDNGPGPPAADEMITARLAVTGYPLVAEVSVPREAALARWRERRTSVVVGAVLGLAALSVIGVLGQLTLQREAAAVETATRRTQELEARTGELHRALGTEKLLMTELEHRVKNSLGLAASMLQLQSARSGNSDVRTLLENARARILAIARVHDRLNDSENPAAVAFDVYLKGLCADVAVNAGFRYTVEADSVVLPTSSAVPLGLIATELLLNAAKHDVGDGEVRVDVAARLGSRGLMLSIRDYGRGVPPDFDPARNAGLGMRVVSSLLAQLGGKLEVENANPGARFAVYVSLEPGRRGAALDRNLESGRGDREAKEAF